VSRGNLNSTRSDDANGVEKLASRPNHQKPLALSAPVPDVEIIDECVDDDPSEEIFSGLKFNTLDKSCMQKRPIAPVKSIAAQPSNIVSFPQRR
jgi:hypothetical protein